MTDPDRITPDDVAHACHEANRVLQAALGQKVAPAWDDAPDWLRRSVVQGVHEALAGATPDVLHDRWVAYKLDEGWRYGPTLDYDAKTHPCLVPHDQLPAGDRAKDTLFHAVVGALAALLAEEEPLPPQLAGCQLYHHLEVHRLADGSHQVDLYCGAERAADGTLTQQGHRVASAVMPESAASEEDAARAWVNRWAEREMTAHRQATMAGPPAEGQQHR